MQFNTANSSFLARDTHIAEVIMIANSSGGIINLSGEGSTATQISNCVNGTTAAITCSFPANVGVTNYLTKLVVTSAATTGNAGLAVLEGIGQANIYFVQPVGGITADIGILDLSFNPPLAANAANSPITFISYAAGTGGIASVVMVGYSQ